MMILLGPGIRFTVTLKLDCVTKVTSWLGTDVVANWRTIWESTAGVNRNLAILFSVFVPFTLDTSISKSYVPVSAKTEAGVTSRRPPTWFTLKGLYIAVPNFAFNIASVVSVGRISPL